MNRHQPFPGQSALKEIEEFVVSLADAGGPKADQYAELTSTYGKIANLKHQSLISEEEIKALRAKFGLSFKTPESMQGHIFHKPFGYAGDFQVIDFIYTRKISDDPQLKHWDEYVQSLEACQAVRNRLPYFNGLVDQLVSSGKAKPRILNVASGPCRELLSTFENVSNSQIHVDCVDIDGRAIAYAREVLGKHSGRVKFIESDVLKLGVEGKYDLIWSAGLFDYFKPRTFAKVLRKLGSWLEPQGSLVIGNFGIENSSRWPMEFAEWYLTYRSEQELTELALQAGFALNAIEIRSDETSINHFLHVRGA